MSAKIVVVGSYNTDLTAYAPRLPRQGETLLGTGFRTGAGGKGSNQAIAAARLDADVTFVGCIGQDDLGDAALAAWQHEGIHTRYVSRDTDHSTGVASIWVDDSTGQNAIIVVAGANLSLGAEAIDTAAEAIARADILIAQLEISLDTTAYALRLARQSGVRTVLNPAPAALLSADVLASADILTPNESELDILTRSVGPTEEAAARSLISRDDQTMVVTLGERGAQMVQRSASRIMPAFPVQVVDTTGAGDCFNGALAVALGEGASLDEAVRFANAAAALCVTQRGTAASMPVRAAVDELLGRAP